MYDDFIKSGVIAPQDLQRLLDGPAPVRVIDASFALPGSPGAGPREGFVKCRIDGAVFFDIEQICDHKTDLPHMLPGQQEFAGAVSAMGISDSDFVVVYGQSGMIMGPARAWWTFRVFGHHRVCVLDGGLPAWLAEGLPVTSGVPAPVMPGHFTAKAPAGVADLEEVKRASRSSSALIMDARSAERFSGRAPEPRPGLRAGHIPGSVNVPAGSLTDPVTGRIRPVEALDAILSEKGLVPGMPVIASCGSGVTACMIALALHHCGRGDIRVYDGAWAEWGQENCNTKVSIL